MGRVTPMRPYPYLTHRSPKPVDRNQGRWGVLVRRCRLATSRRRCRLAVSALAAAAAVAAPAAAAAAAVASAAHTPLVSTD